MEYDCAGAGGIIGMMLMSYCPTHLSTPFKSQARFMGPCKRMLLLHSWNSGWTRDTCFFQEDIGEELTAKIEQIRFKY